MGKHEPACSGDLIVDIWRGGVDGSLVRYQVPTAANQTVLDVVTWVQRHLEPDLAYRFACRVGMCGSCAVTVNGIPRWACRTLAAAVAKSGRLEIRPLRNLPVIKDLVVDMTGFFDRWRDGHGRFEPKRPDAAGFATIAMADPKRRAASAAIECIGCGVCFAACDTAASDPLYLGPAALNRAWAGVNDERDRQGARLDALKADGGPHACHSQGNCSRFCPVGLEPLSAIAGLKRRLVSAVLRGEA